MDVEATELQRAFAEVIVALKNGTGPVADRLLAEYVARSTVPAVLFGVVACWALLRLWWLGRRHRNALVVSVDRQRAFDRAMAAYEATQPQLNMPPEERHRLSLQPRVDRPSECDYLTAPCGRTWKDEIETALGWWWFSFIVAVICSAVCLYHVSNAVAPAVNLLERLVR